MLIIPYWVKYSYVFKSISHDWCSTWTIYFYCWTPQMNLIWTKFVYLITALAFLVLLNFYLFLSLFSNCPKFMNLLSHSHFICCIYFRIYSYIYIENLNSFWTEKQYEFIFLSFRHAIQVSDQEVITKKWHFWQRNTSMGNNGNL